MEGRPTLRVTPRVVFGLILVALGTLMTLSNLGLDFDKLFEYWPVALILVGVAKIARRSFPSGTFWIAAGTIFLIPKLTDRVDLGDLWPLIPVLFGLRMVMRSFGGKPRPKEDRREVSPTIGPTPGRAADEGSEHTAHLMAFFSSSRQIVASQQFRGGDLVAILGGCELDLREARLAGGKAVINALAMWGGVDVKVPADWNVSLEVTPVLGGAEDNRNAEGAAPLGADGDVLEKLTRKLGSALHDDEPPHLVVKGLALMGGVDIRS